MPYAAAVAVGALVSYSGQQKAAKAGKKGAKDMARQSEKNAKENKAIADSTYTEQVGRMQPWHDAGLKALSKIEAGIENGEFTPEKFHFDYDSFEKDPGYQFRIDEGTRAMEQSAAASGKLLSGQQQKALLGYGQKMGSQEYQNSFNRAAQEWGMNANRLQNNFNMLNALNTQGFGAAQNMNAAASDRLSAITGANNMNNTGQLNSIGMNSMVGQQQGKAMSDMGGQIMGWGMGKMGGGGTKDTKTTDSSTAGSTTAK